VPRRFATAVVARGAALALAAALASAGCVSTSMSAAELRVPVLFGPVPCIGCTAGARPASAAPVSHVANGDAALGLLMFIITPVGIVSATAGESESRAISPDRLLYWTACRNDLQLNNLRARAWQATVPIFYFQYEVAVEADATEAVVPGASCFSP
jgi:hypothetical protein